MKMITDAAALADLCAEFSQAPYITVDTEFMRERTYWSKLCLVQMARPGTGDEDAVLIDPLTDGMDLSPLMTLMTNPDVVKVFHAARQDVEIFHNIGGDRPGAAVRHAGRSHGLRPMAIRWATRRWCAVWRRPRSTSRRGSRTGRAAR